MIGNRERDAGAAARIRLELERESFAVQMPQPRACIADADALARGTRGKATSVVHHFAPQHVAIGSDPDTHLSRTHTIPKAMAQCVLHQGLEEKRWHPRIEHAFVDVEGNREAVAESKAH